MSLLLLACQEPTPRFTRLEGEAQGTTFRIVYAGRADYSKSIDSVFRVIDRSLSLWDTASIISGFNAGRPGSLISGKWP